MKQTDTLHRVISAEWNDDGTMNLVVEGRVDTVGAGDFVVYKKSKSDLNDSKQTDTDTLIEALRILAREIHCEDGVATSVIREAADRIETLDKLATDVVRRAVRGDQHFISALDDDSERTRLLRYSIARLDDQLKEW